MVVDDERRIREGIITIFPWEQMGYEIVASFESSLKALEYISVNPVDVVLTDIRMPLLDGVELVSKIRSLRPRTEYVFISGYRDFEYAKSAITLGVWEYITKPFRRDEVIAVFRQLKNKLDRCESDSSAGSNPPSYYDGIVTEVKSYVHGHLADATLEGAALEAGLSAGYLSKLFKQRAGVSFSDYLLSHKMKRSAELLTGTRMKCYEISDLIGYDNPKNFSRSFKNYYGISPREYREKGVSLP